MSKHSTTRIVSTSLFGKENLAMPNVLNTANIKDAQPYSDDNTPLHIAAQKGDFMACGQLIAKGANIHAQNADGDTPLTLAYRQFYTFSKFPFHDAARRGDIKACQLFIMLGAQFTHDSIGYTPLHYAALGGHTEICRLFLNHSNLTITDPRYKQTALHLAAKAGHVDTVELLLATKNSPINVQDFYGYTPLMYLLDAPDRNHLGSLVRSFMQSGVNTHLTNTSGETALHIAAANGLIDICNILMTPATKDHDGNTPLMLLASTVIRGAQPIPLWAGDDIHETDSAGYTLLHREAATGRVLTCKNLIALGADIQARTPRGDTPLHLAVDNGHDALAEELITLGANVNTPNQYDETALHIAAVTRSYSTLFSLIKAGANIHAEDAKGNTPLTRFMNRLHEDRPTEYPQVGEIFHQAARNDHRTTLKVMVSLGMDVNAINPAGDTALHIAAEDGNVESIHMLIALGANIHAVDAQGRTPLARLATVLTKNSPKEYPDSNILRHAMLKSRHDAVALFKALGATHQTETDASSQPQMDPDKTWRETIIKRMIGSRSSPCL